MNIEMVQKEIKLYRQDGSYRGSRMIEVPMIRDEYTDELCYTPEGAAMIDKIIAESAGFMLPSEIKDLREKLGLTQIQISRLLNLGDKTWTRWETGAAIPDPANRQRMAMLRDGHMSIYDLQEPDSNHSWFELLGNRSIITEQEAHQFVFSFEDDVELSHETIPLAA